VSLRKNVLWRWQVGWVIEVESRENGRIGIKDGVKRILLNSFAVKWSREMAH
jgi:hypothetical protein